MNNNNVYILTNKNHTVMYVGLINNPKSRLDHHKDKSNKGFTKKYNVHKLVYFETTTFENNALKREKQIKHWRRQWKENLINDMNPDREDLSWMLDE